jgi:predicted Rossmann-fold nucleotide-binding protein
VQDDRVEYPAAVRAASESDITPELNFDFHYFHAKYWFAYLAKALVVFPGGFGTLDEMFESLTLAQTRERRRRSRW